MCLLCVSQLTPLENGWKIKSEKMQIRAVFYVYVIFCEQSGQACVENGAILTTFFIQIYFRMQITEQLLLSPTQARSSFGSYLKGSEWRPKRKLQMNGLDSDKAGGQEIKLRISEYWCTRHASTNNLYVIMSFHISLSAFRPFGWHSGDISQCLHFCTKRL